ncbi:unnamed protein product [Paramecium pentaurelia]|uniref:Uncharacterized protein n=1 Tax=Paramecium pentaurelia TaxID=43138 RepID=A0A8S1YJT7_9CILI|nr:unnamed protein product [Paramecium pentaurelia]
MSQEQPFRCFAFINILLFKKKNSSYCQTFLKTQVNLMNRFDLGKPSNFQSEYLKIIQTLQQEERISVEVQVISARRIQILSMGRSKIFDIIFVLIIE